MTVGSILSFKSKKYGIGSFLTYVNEKRIQSAQLCTRIKKNKSYGR